MIQMTTPLPGLLSSILAGLPTSPGPDTPTAGETASLSSLPERSPEVEGTVRPGGARRRAHPALLSLRREGRALPHNAGLV